MKDLEMPANQEPASPSLEKLHSETAQICWTELQRFFAQGVVIRVDQELDLVTTALLFAQDEKAKLEPLLADGRVGPPSDKQAKTWFAQNSQLWSVVVAPFVLVQEPAE